MHKLYTRKIELIRELEKHTNKCQNLYDELQEIKTALKYYEKYKYL